jgi:SnoaL-like polyketide cyclase
VARVQWTGTQDGPFQGRPPTHNKLRFSTSDFFRIENGKFTEHWDVVDSFPRAIALGLVPPPAREGGSWAALEMTGYSSSLGWESPPPYPGGRNAR